MNKNLKTLLSAGVISLAILGGKTITSDALSYGYTSANLNLRQYASTTSRKLGVIPRGSKINIYKSYGNWYSIRYGNTWGYVNKNYVENNTNNNTNINDKNVVSNKGQVLNRLIIVNKDSRKVAFYRNGKLIASFHCAIGKSSTPTPNGSFTIINKEVNRPYYKGNIKGGAKNNPLGKYFMQLTTTGYALHCNLNKSTEGKAVSNGCIRMYEKDAQWLYNNTTVGTRVVIGTGYNKNIASAYGYKIY